MRNSHSDSHDPKVCVTGWDGYPDNDDCVYLEGSYNGLQGQLNKGGANVFIRNSKTRGL